MSTIDQTDAGEHDVTSCGCHFIDGSPLRDLERYDAPRTITAVPAGRDRDGNPITRRYTYVIDREPEPFGKGRSRIFSENRTFPNENGGYLFTPDVVLTDSIEPVETVEGPVSTRPFQAGDRILVDRPYGETFSGVIDTIMPATDAHPSALAYVWPDNDPERSGLRRIVSLTPDLTASAAHRTQLVELWDGGINGASTGVDTYDCAEPDCDFNVSAVGPQDPDEPDYYAEDIEAHKRGHETAAEIERDAAAKAPAIAELFGTTVAPQPALPAEARTALADAFSSAAQTVFDADPIRDSGIEDDLDAPVPYVPVDDGFSKVLAEVGAVSAANNREDAPALVKLDQDDAADRVMFAAIAWENATQGAVDLEALVRASDELHAAVRDYLAAVTR